MNSAYFPDLVALATYVVVFGLYFVVSAIRSKRNPIRAVQSVNHAVRDSWVRHVISDPALAIQGVQTLRNSTMAATFFASTAVLLMIGTLNLIGQADHFSDIWGTLLPGTSHGTHLWTVKVLALVTDLFFAFFAFAMSVRFFNHVGYQVSLPTSARPPWLHADGVAHMMNRAGKYYSLGMRAYFLAVPLVFGLFGAPLMVGATLFTCFFMMLLERAPLGKRKKG